MQSLARLVRALDPRLKMAMALALGPSLWLLAPAPVAVCGVLLSCVVRALSASQPLGAKMVRSMMLFVILWVAVKAGFDSLSAIPPEQVAVDAGILALRLSALLLLGLGLALSTSAQALGMAVSWAIRPLLGGERAWKFALSLALMVHFLPLCLSTVNQVKETLSRRCPDCPLRRRLVIIPQAVLRNLGQKTWNQTLAVAGRGLERAAAWEPEFTWRRRDTVCSLLACCVAAILYLLSFPPVL